MEVALQSTDNSPLLLTYNAISLSLSLSPSPSLPQFLTNKHPSPLSSLLSPLPSTTTPPPHKMLTRLIGPHRTAQIQKILHKTTLTLLCLLLTIIMIRSLLGAGNYGTPEHDFHLLHSTFISSDSDPHPYRTRRILQLKYPFDSETDTHSSYSLSNFSNSYNTFNLNSILSDDKPEPEKDPNTPFSLGPKISDWDHQRQTWLKNNPDFPNFVHPNKPRVLMITGSSPKACENPVGDHYLLKSIKNKLDYCRIHGLELFYNFALYDAEMSGFWAKLPLVKKLLLSHPEVEFLWWMDSDAMFTDMVFELPWERYKDHNLIMHGWDEKVYDQKDWVGLNTGSFLIRNCQWTLDLLDVWAPMGPRGKVREEAGALLTRELKGRPVFEADDQSAMVYILATQKERWSDKVYLEDQYYLHGYWGMIVDKYEEMLEKYHAGMGDHRWPLVTHFVGCKPCSKIGDYSLERCLKSMDRAFHFGDNQVLQMYGFNHKSLGSRRVVRIRNESSNPLEDVRDELGLLHPPYKAVKVSS